MGLSYRSAFIVAVLVFVLSSCRTNQAIVSTQTEVKDSISTTIEVTYRDTVITTERDTAISIVRIICDSNLVPRIERNGKQQEEVVAMGEHNAMLKMKLHEGWLTGFAECSKIQHELEIAEKTIKELRSKQTTKTETKIVMKEYTPLWKQSLAWIGGFAIAITVIGIILKIKG